MQCISIWRPITLILVVVPMMASAAHAAPRLRVLSPLKPSPTITFI